MFGISSIFHAVRDIAHDAVDVVSSVENVVNPVALGLDLVGLDNVNEATRQVWEASVDVAIGTVENTVESIGEIGEGVKKLIVDGDAEGLLGIGSGFIDLTYGSAADSALYGFAKAIGAAQTLTFTETEGRKLKPDEIIELRKIYGDSIDYDAVIIKEGETGIVAAFTGARTLGNTIYVNKDKLPLEQGLLTHEMGHVWQFQNGGTDYMREAIAGQLGDGEDWEAGIGRGYSFSELSPEQQAELMRDIYEANFNDADPAARFVTKAGVDHTDYARDALRQVRDGDGTH